MTQCMRGRSLPGVLHAPARNSPHACRSRLSHTRTCIRPVCRPRYSSFRQQRSRASDGHAASNQATSDSQDESELANSLLDVGASKRKGASAISVDQASSDGEAPQPRPDTQGCCDHDHGSAEEPTNPVHAVLLWVYKRTGTVFKVCGPFLQDKISAMDSSCVRYPPRV